LNHSAEGIVGEFSYTAAVLGDFDDAVLVVIFVFIAVLVCNEISGFVQGKR
jgi:ABC-type phosphate/phosphonate transport system permease subunit